MAIANCRGIDRRYSMTTYAAGMQVQPPQRQVRASFTETTIRVYQAFSPEIAANALAAQTFTSPFKRGRMTWIKPSFTWMMYRSGFATKPGQERVLAIDVLRQGFEYALAHSTLSHFDPTIHASKDAWEAVLHESPVRIQWDPERTVDLRALAWRAIQIGLSAKIVDAYVDQWIVRVDDVTALAHQIHSHVERQEIAEAVALLPAEGPYPLSGATAKLVGASNPVVVKIEWST